MMKLPMALFPVILLLSSNFCPYLHSKTDTSSATGSGAHDQHVKLNHLGEELTAQQLLRLEALNAIHLKDWKTASSKLKAAFLKDPNDPEVYLDFAKFHYARKEYASCENAIHKGLEKSSTHAGLLYESSRVLVLKDDLQLATSQAKLATQSIDSKWIHHYWFSHLLTLNGKTEAAKSELVLAIRRLEEDIKKQHKAINDYEQQEKILSSYTAIEDVPVGSIGGGYKQIEVVKYNTERMVAPDVWKNKLKSLIDKKVELEQKLKAF